MKKKRIKVHLAPYSIFQKRTTTISHAFASAIAPTDKYDESRLDDALRMLRQDPEGDLLCVYCDNQAKTWDHLVGLVKDGDLRGFGHQLGNLVPCCSRCNSEKGSKDWSIYLRESIKDQVMFEEKSKMLNSYTEKYAIPVELERMKEKLPEDWKRYCEIKAQIFDLMKKADEVAKRLRGEVTSRKP